MSEAPRDGAPAAWTVRRVLDWTRERFERAGSPSPRADADWLMAHVLGLTSRTAVYLDLDRPLTDTERAAMREVVRRRAAGEPVQYITGVQGFYGRTFRVDRRVLVPRPETEELVAHLLTRLGPERRRAPLTVLDVGTGSGVIAVTLALECPGARVTATDIDADALDAARAAGTALRAEVEWLHGALYEPVAGRRFDVIVSNPPYVADSPAGRARLSFGTAAFEPARALFGGTDGLSVLRPLIAEAPLHLAPGGLLAVEIGADQAQAVEAPARAAGLGDVVVEKDHARIPRMLFCKHMETPHA